MKQRDILKKCVKEEFIIRKKTEDFSGLFDEKGKETPLYNVQEEVSIFFNDE